MKAKCYDPKWRYHKACETDVSKTIAKEKRRLAALAEAEQSKKVTPIKRKNDGR